MYRLNFSRGLVYLVSAISLAGAFRVDACTTVIIGKKRTVDGSVMMAHSEDIGKNSAHHLAKIDRKVYYSGDVFELYSKGALAQPPLTYAFIASKIFDKSHYPGDYTSGINEFQVSISNNMSWTRGVPYEKAWDILPGGIIWSEFMQIALERSKSAREAVKTIGELCERYDLSADPGTMFGVADPEEGWWIEIAKGGQWIAQRISDDAVSMRANVYRIGVVNLADRGTVLHSARLISYATEKGWYDALKDGPFDFAKVYGDPSEQEKPSSLLRHEMVDRFFSDGAKVEVSKLFKLLRWCYEDTEKYQDDPKTGSPWRTTNRTISMMTTEISSVAHLRRWLPADIGGLMWWNMGISKTGVYLPWYLGTECFPEPFCSGTKEYSWDSAYWRFRELANLVDRSYQRTLPLATEVWEPMEKLVLEQQPVIEGDVMRLHQSGSPSSVRRMLTEYSTRHAFQVYKNLPALMSKVKSVAYSEEEERRQVPPAAF